MKKEKKIKTHIAGLDKMLNGGIIKGRNILLSGSAGTGKTTFGMQFIYNGVIKNKEPGLYVTLEEDTDKIYADMAKFGLNLKKQKNFHLIGGSIGKISKGMDKVDAKVMNLIEEIEDVIKEKKIKRVVIDSINIMTMLMDSDKEKRLALAKLGNMLSTNGCTSILLSETKEGTMELSRYGMEEFVVDGVIVLYLVRNGASFLPGIVVRKMRGTAHDKDIRMYQITNKGIKVFPEETMFTDV